jgi:hypothetical protein
MNWTLGLPTECVGCSTKTVMRINGNPVCKVCAEHEPPAPRVLAKISANAQ